MGIFGRSNECTCRIIPPRDCCQGIAKSGDHEMQSAISCVHRAPTLELLSGRFQCEFSAGSRLKSADNDVDVKRNEPDAATSLFRPSEMSVRGRSLNRRVGRSRGRNTHQNKSSRNCGRKFDNDDYSSAGQGVTHFRDGRFKCALGFFHAQAHVRGPA